MPEDSNNVELQCVTAANASPNSGAVFLLNGTVLSQVQGIFPQQTADGVLVAITRELEGTYSCYLPSDPSVLSSPQNIVGERHKLHCSWSSKSQYGRTK